MTDNTNINFNLPGHNNISSSNNWHAPNIRSVISLHVNAAAKQWRSLSPSMCMNLLWVILTQIVIINCLDTQLQIIIMLLHKSDTAVNTQLN